MKGEEFSEGENMFPRSISLSKSAGFDYVTLESAREVSYSLLIKEGVDCKEPSESLFSIKSKEMNDALITSLDEIWMHKCFVGIIRKAYSSFWEYGSSLSNWQKRT